TALHFTLHENISEIVTLVQDNMPVALFAMLEHLPWSAFTSLVATVLVITFFVTSYDSGSLVICMLTSGGMEEPPTWMRIFWAVAEGVVAAVLLVAGGLAALQTAAITSALPFTLIMLLICIGLMRGLRLSRQGFAIPDHLPALMDPGAGRARTWRHRIHNMFTFHTREEIIDYLRSVAKPALERAAGEFEQKNINTVVTDSEETVTFTVYHEGYRDFIYTVRLHSYVPTFVLPDYTRPHHKTGRYYKAEVDVNNRKTETDITGYSQDQIIHNMLGHYENHMEQLEPEAAQ
ncbi:MAG: BCCT family transporter, partial [Gammaproteobacteria bacterium]